MTVRIIINILSNSELNWTGIGELNSDDHYINYCGQESYRRNGGDLIINKKILICTTWVQPSKWQNDFGSFPRKAIQYHSNSSLCPYHWHQRSWSWSVLWRPRRLPRSNTKKRCSIHPWELKCKSKKSRDTQNNRQVWLWSIKWSREKANILSEEHAGHSKHPFPTTQEMTHMDISRGPVLKSDWL